jgi:hypothetical protein
MRRLVSILLLLACAALLAGTFALLLGDRVESGDFYPSGSSLRSDPQGTMIFFESLRGLPGVTVVRDQRAVNELPPGAGTAYLQLDASRYAWDGLPRDVFRVVDNFLLDGGRLVVAFAPESGPTEEEKKREEAREKEREEKEKGKKKDEKSDKEKPKDKEDDDLVSLEKRWGLRLALGTQKGTGKTTEVRNVSGLPLPAELRWHGDVYLEKPDASWKVIYKGRHGAVLAERRRGAGSIVVATDSFFVSNEALARTPHPDLLAWLVGDAHHIVFDEAHHGIVDSPGIASLARKYRLHGAVLALLVLAALFLWKSSSPLAPRRADTDARDDVLPGRAASAGFVTLLRRNIPRDRVFDVCIGEWRRSFAQGSRFSPAEKEAVEAIVREEQARPARERDYVAVCRKICAALDRRAPKPTA